MLSRAALRSLPRTSSRIAHYTTRASLRPALQSSSSSSLPSRPATLISQRLHAPLRAAFSTTPRRRDDRSQELAAKLENEIALESENSEESHASDNNIKLFFDQNDFWSLEEQEGQLEVLLRRQYDDEIITVSFNVVDFTPTSILPEDEADESYLDEDEDIDTPQSGGANSKGAVNQGRTSGGNIAVAPEDSIAPADNEDMAYDGQDDESQQAFPANVAVLIQRPGRGALRINLVADGTRFTIHGVTHLPESTASASDQLRNTPEHLYTGPPFQQLDDEVQAMLESYLEARGINEGLAVVIPDYIDVKEQREYVKWLGRVKEFVE